MYKYGCKKKEILKFVLSMILASLSINLMFVVDRMVLGLHSLDAVNAVGLGGNFIATAGFMMTSIAQMAAVFTGQYNGSGADKKTAWAPWQMFYFGIASFLFFVPLGIWCDKLNMFPDYCAADGVAYTRILLLFAGLNVMSVAISSFFIGRAQSYIVIAVFLLGNIVNAILDVIFVLGVPGFIEPMGAKGAAIATVIVEIMFFTIFFSVFLNKSNREQFNTHDYKFRKSLFWQCVKIGLPVSFGKFTSLLGWFSLMYFFINTSPDLATVETFAVTIWMAFIFFADGAGRAISSLAANLIGQKNLESIQALLKLFLKYNFILCAVYAIPLIFYQDMTLAFFSKANGDISGLIPDIKFVLVSIWMTLLTDGMFYLITGVLTAGGDTKYPTIVEVATLWIIVVLPTGLMYFSETLKSIRIAYTLIPITGFLNVGLIYLRYKKLKWYKQLVDVKN